MIEKATAMVDGWIESFDLLPQEWRVGLVVFALVFGTATVAYLASYVIGALERKFSKTRNLWDDALLHAARKPIVGFGWLQGVDWAAEVAHKYSDAASFEAKMSAASSTISSRMAFAGRFSLSIPEVCPAAFISRSSRPALRIEYVRSLMSAA